MKHELLAGATSALLLFLGITKGPDIKPAPTHSVFTIAVVGTDLEHKHSVKGPCTPETAEAMLRGVRAAYDKSPPFKELRNFIVYKTFDDQGDPLVAEKLAATLEEDDSIIAVIGHSCSATTAGATAHYAEAQIPFLIPVATSRTVGYYRKTALAGNIAGPDDSTPLQHYSNVFRVIPNDQIGQAPTIRYIVRALTDKKGTGAAVAYRTADNPEYVKDLAADLKALLDVPQIELGCKEQSMPCMSWNTTTSPSVLVLIGTTVTARDFLQSSAFDAVVKSGLKFLILTDGAKNLETLNDCPQGTGAKCMSGMAALQKAADNNIQVLLTFPTKQLNPTQLRIADNNYSSLADAFSGPQSYEEYSYTAMLLLADVINKLTLDKNATIDRATLIKELGQKTTLTGAAGTIFIFDRGENVHPDYSIYVGGSADVAMLGNKLCEDGSRSSLQPNQLRYLCFIRFDRAYLGNEQ